MTRKSKKNHSQEHISNKKWEKSFGNDSLLRKPRDEKFKQGNVLLKNNLTIEIPDASKVLSKKELYASSKNTNLYEFKEIDSVVSPSSCYEWSFDGKENVMIITKNEKTESDNPNCTPMIYTNEQRMNHSRDGGKSPREAIRDLKCQNWFHSTLGKYAKWENKTIGDGKLQLDALFATTSPCPTFGVTNMMALIEKFKPKSIFDPFAGWGDVMIASAMSGTVEEYVGFEIMPNLKSSFEQMMFDFKEELNFDPSGYRFYETSILDLEYIPYKNMDMTIVSLPLYRYNDYKKSYPGVLDKNCEEWRYNFYYNSIYFSSLAVRKGGYVIVQLFDLMNDDKITDSILYDIGEIGNMELLGCIGMNIKKHHTTYNIGDGSCFMGSPVWIFQVL
jgi:hypothetical protein